MNQTYETYYDIIVVGAGPAGTASAIRLAGFGFDIAILESAAFPRPHVGICLSDQTLSLLDFVGAGKGFSDAEFWRRNTTAVSWGTGDINFVQQSGFHVDRGILDQLLLDQARTVGVKVFQPVHELRATQSQSPHQKVSFSMGDTKVRLNARFIVDASGRRSALDSTRVRDSQPLIAFHANWSLGKSLKFDGMIEAGRNAWLWYAQSATNRAVLSVFCDPRRTKSKLNNDLQSVYKELLMQFGFVHTDKIGHQISAVQGCDASSFHSPNPIGESHIRVGDACFSVDPLSSQGVHLALQSGIQSAVVVNTILNRPMNIELAKKFYQTRTREKTRQYIDKAKLEYSRVATIRDNHFWSSRAGKAHDQMTAALQIYPEPQSGPPPKIARVSSQVSFNRVPAIYENFVEEHYALEHPNTKKAIAYVDEIEIFKLICKLTNEFKFDDIPQLWQDHVSPEKSRRIANWLWDNRIVVEAK